MRVMRRRLRDRRDAPGNPSPRPGRGSALVRRISAAFSRHDVLVQRTPTVSQPSRSGHRRRRDVFGHNVFKIFREHASDHHDEGPEGGSAASRAGKSGNRCRDHALIGGVARSTATAGVCRIEPGLERGWRPARPSFSPAYRRRVVTAGPGKRRSSRYPPAIVRRGMTGRHIAHAAGVARRCQRHPNSRLAGTCA